MSYLISSSTRGRRNHICHQLSQCRCPLLLPLHHPGQSRWHYLPHSIHPEQRLQRIQVPGLMGGIHWDFSSNTAWPKLPAICRAYLKTKPLRSTCASQLVEPTSEARLRCQHLIQSLPNPLIVLAEKEKRAPNLSPSWRNQRRSQNSRSTERTSGAARRVAAPHHRGVQDQNLGPQAAQAAEEELMPSAPERSTAQRLQRNSAELKGNA